MIKPMFKPLLGLLIGGLSLTAHAGDDYLVDDDAAKYESTAEQPMPNSAVAFQMVVSWVL